MAIEYIFQLCTPTPVGAIRGLLGPEEPTSTGLRITVRPDGRASFVLVEPEISVGFRLDKFTEPEPQYAEIAALVVRVLEAEPGDAVLQQDFERILLLRRGRELLVSPSFWAPEVLPWEFTERLMPYPEDY
ncbi:SitI3 family protein [Kribbella sp. NPDC005582]|uniref:SitI3 family protein n=1 Tax=Kribbella sp. NPDC005582 TaxID=3156893 RepID=UPI0033B4F3E5